MPIQKLPSHLIKHIQSGEVISHYHHIVKELIENSIDSSPSSIKIRITQDEIIVTDNGCGISQENFHMLFQRNCTSKLNLKEYENTFQTENMKTNNSFFDVNQYINFYGFRGEALASISEIATVEMKTRTKDLQYGYRITVNDEKSSNNVSKIAMEQGTSIKIAQIFHSFPLRQSLMKKDFKRELFKIFKVIISYCINTPHIKWEYQVKNKILIWPLEITNNENSFISHKIKILECFFSCPNKLIHTEEKNILIIHSSPFHSLESLSILLLINKRVVSYNPLQKEIVEAYKDIYVGNKSSQKKYPLIYMEIDTKADVNCDVRKEKVLIDEKIYKKAVEMIKINLKRHSKSDSIKIKTFERKQSSNTPKDLSENKDPVFSYPKVYKNNEHDLKELFDEIEKENTHDQCILESADQSIVTDSHVQRKHSNQSTNKGTNMNNHEKKEDLHKENEIIFSKTDQKIKDKKENEDLSHENTEENIHVDSIDLINEETSTFYDSDNLHSSMIEANTLNSSILNSSVNELETANENINQSNKESDSKENSISLTNQKDDPIFLNKKLNENLINSCSNPNTNETDHTHISALLFPNTVYVGSFSNTLIFIQLDSLLVICHFDKLLRNYSRKRIEENFENIRFNKNIEIDDIVIKREEINENHTVEHLVDLFTNKVLFTEQMNYKKIYNKIKKYKKIEIKDCFKRVCSLKEIYKAFERM